MSVHPIHVIQAEVAAECGVTIERMLGRERIAHIVRARRIAMWRARKAGYSSTTIGLFFGGRNHTTVLYAIRRVEGDAQMLAAADHDRCAGGRTSDAARAGPVSRRRDN